ncbi:hypothetical protein K437DRAFT_255252 [Tilletiaria anomala UBC 951]|uniref:Uncharacterized protein n=1 Tax=Tilletiaria anomala (strain ATCC 24038 / CBS 436.72 / UBC 951) TaxID=1037660 RepID=A0A066W6H4_TILAU|nr:uncharacterized protein K437DRAFT_255252 [Tilletiaria anomala UBC 951]KDN49577.1 hypothetical protein K437DRAFT_255252 [Tilletiaria anomala UBC 951]
MEADPWSSSSPWAEPDGNSAAVVATLPSFSVSDGSVATADAPRSTGADTVDYNAAPRWGPASPASTDPIEGASASATQGGGPRTPSTSGLDPPQWGSISPSSDASYPKANLTKDAASWCTADAPPATSFATAEAVPRNTADDATPPASARSTYSTASYSSAKEKVNSTSSTASQSAAPASAGEGTWGCRSSSNEPASATGSAASGWAPIRSPGYKFSSASSLEKQGGESTSTSSIPPRRAEEARGGDGDGWGGESNASLSTSFNEIGIADSGSSRLTPVSAGWGGALGGGGEGVADGALVDEESPWGAPPPEPAAEATGSPGMSPTLSSAALQAAIERKLAPEKAQGAEKGKKPPQISVPPIATDNDGAQASVGSGASTPRDPQSATSAQQATWLARLRASQKSTTSPQIGRASLESDQDSARVSKDGSAKKEEGSKKPGFVQTSKQDATKGAAGMISSLIASAKKGVAPAAVVSAADEDDEDEPAPQTGTTASFASNPDSARDLLSFDDESEKKARAAAAANKMRPDTDEQQTESVVTRWFGRWGGGKREDAPAHIQAGVSEESYADRLEGAEGHLSHADLEWLDKTAPQVHSAGGQQPYSAGPVSRQAPAPAGGAGASSSLCVPARQQQPQRSTSGGTSTSGSPRDHWLTMDSNNHSGAKSPAGPQFATSGPHRPVRLEQAPCASHNGPRGASMTGPLMSNGYASAHNGPSVGQAQRLTPQSARISSAGSAQSSANLFGEFQSETFSDWSPVPARAACIQSLEQHHTHATLPACVAPPSHAPAQARSDNYNLSSPNPQGLRTPASIVASEFSPAPSSDGFGSPTGQLIGCKGDRKPPGILEQRNRFAGGLDPYASVPFASGRAGTIDDGFGKDYRDDDDDDDVGGVLGGGAPGYRDEPAIADPLPTRSRLSTGAGRMSQPPPAPAVPTRAKAAQPTFSGLDDLLGDMSIEESNAPDARQTEKSSKVAADDLLGDFLCSPRATASSSSQPYFTGIPPEKQTHASRPSAGTALGPAPPAPPAAMTNKGGPLLPPPPGQTRAGGLLPPPPGRATAAVSSLLSGLGGQQQTRSSIDVAQVQSDTQLQQTQGKAKANGPSAGRGMTADDLSFFETL